MSERTIRLSLELPASRPVAAVVERAVLCELARRLVIFEVVEPPGADLRLDLRDEATQIALVPLVVRHVPKSAVDARRRQIEATAGAASEVLADPAASPTEILAALATWDGDDRVLATLAHATNSDPTARQVGDEMLDRFARDAVVAASKRLRLDPLALALGTVADLIAESASLRARIDATARDRLRARRALSEALQGARQELDVLEARLEVTRGELKGASEHRDHLASELDAVYATKTFRATSAFRNIYRRMRSRR